MVAAGIRQKTGVSPFDAQPGGQIGSVPVGDVGVVPQEDRDLLVGVEADAPGHQHGPVLVTSQLHVVGSLATLLLFLRHGRAGVCFGKTPKTQWRHGCKKQS